MFTYYKINKLYNTSHFGNQHIQFIYFKNIKHKYSKKYLIKIIHLFIYAQIYVYIHTN